MSAFPSGLVPLAALECNTNARCLPEKQCFDRRPRREVSMAAIDYVAAIVAVDATPYQPEH